MIACLLVKPFRDDLASIVHLNALGKVTLSSQPLHIWASVAWLSVGLIRTDFLIFYLLDIELTKASFDDFNFPAVYICKSVYGGFGATHGIDAIR